MTIAPPSTILAAAPPVETALVAPLLALPPAVLEAPEVEVDLVVPVAVTELEPDAVDDVVLVAARRSVKLAHVIIVLFEKCTTMLRLPKKADEPGNRET